MNKREVKNEVINGVAMNLQDSLRVQEKCVGIFSPVYALTDHSDVRSPAVKTPTCGLKMVPQYCFPATG